MSDKYNKYRVEVDEASMKCFLVTSASSDLPNSLHVRYKIQVTTLIKILKLRKSKVDVKVVERVFITTKEMVFTFRDAPKVIFNGSSLFMLPNSVRDILVEDFLFSS